MASGIIYVFQDKLQKNVEEAKTSLESLDKYQAWIRARMAARIKSIFGVMSKVETCLDEAFMAACTIETRLKLETIATPQTEEEKLVAHFHSPELRDNVVLNFRSDTTQEGQLLGKLLALRGKEHVPGVSGVGSSRERATHVMCGIGKTTALRAIWHQDEVEKAFQVGFVFWNSDKIRKTVMLSDNLSDLSAISVGRTLS